MNAHPFAKKNAIEAIAFVMVFERSFFENENEALLSLEHTLKNEFQSFATIRSFNINIAGEKDELTQPSISNYQNIGGVLLQHFQSNGKPDWSLRTENEKIVVTCFDYDRWDTIWPKARNFLLRAAHVVSSETNPVTQCGMQVIDKFIYTDVDRTYNIEDVFNISSPFLSKHVLDSGKFWHIHQGWFENSLLENNENGKILNILNISTDYDGSNEGDLNCAIDHIGQYNFDESAPIEKLIGKNYNEQGTPLLNELFLELHINNKKILENLLSEEQLKKIGLKAE